MKCIEVEKNINLLLDGEAGGRERQELKIHLADCRQCREEFKFLRKTKGLLAMQPAVLPKEAFDNRMLRMFEDKLKPAPKPKKGWVAGLCALSRPSFAAALAIFAIGLGLSFQVGRWSVSSQSHLTAGQEAENTILPPPLETQMPKQDIPPGETAYSDKTVTKTIVKYVKVPVIRTRLVERPMEAEGSDKNRPAVMPKKSRDRTENRAVNLAGRMNLKDLQPIANVTYKIIRKGENNEE